MSLIDQLIDVIRNLAERVSTLELQESPFQGGVLPVDSGGTGATTAAAARSALGTNDAGNVTIGTLDAARLGSSPTSSKVLFGDNTWRTLVASDLPAHTHDAGDIATGTLAVARVPSLPASQIATGTMAAARLGSGTPSAATLLFGDSTWATLAAADIPNLDANKITTGTMATARLGSGTANSTTALFGDQTYKTVAQGSGGADRVAFWSGANALSSQSNFTWNGSTLVIPGAVQTGGNPAYVFGSYSAGTVTHSGTVSISVGGTIRKFMIGT